MTNPPVLRRDADRRVLGGVCSGLARWWNVDPLLVRMAAVVAAIVSSGMALIAYLTLWLVFPTDRGSGRAPRLLRVAAAVVVVIAAGAFLLPESRFAAVGFALLGLACLSWYVASRTPLRRPVPLTGQPQWQQPPMPGRSSPSASGEGRLARSRSWAMLLGSTLLCWAGLATLDAAGIDVRPGAYPAVALAVLGFALLRSSRSRATVLRRPRGLVPIGVATALVTLSMIGAPTAAPNSTVFSDPATLPSTLDLGSGTRTIDLSQLTLDHDRTLRITQDAGSLTVILPAAASVEARYVVDMGGITTPETGANGMDLDIASAVVTAGGPTLTLHVELAVGQLEVRR